MTIQPLGQIVETLVPLDLAAPPTPENFRAAFFELGQMDKGSASVGIWRGQTPWEYHDEGNEFLHVLQGKVIITLILEGVREEYQLIQNSVFIVPVRVWHRSCAEKNVTLLSVLASPHGPVSFAEDPQSREHLVSEAEIFDAVSS